VSDLKAEPTLDKTDSGDDDVLHLCETPESEYALCGKAVDEEVLPPDAPDVNICVVCGSIAMLRGYS
jgi:hypothetical protein